VANAARQLQHNKADNHHSTTSGQLSKAATAQQMGNHHSKKDANKYKLATTMWLRSRFNLLPMHQSGLC